MRITFFGRQGKNHFTAKTAWKPFSPVDREKNCSCAGVTVASLLALRGVTSVLLTAGIPTERTSDSAVPDLGCPDCRRGMSWLCELPLTGMPESGGTEMRFGFPSGSSTVLDSTGDIAYRSAT